MMKTMIVSGSRNPQGRTAQAAGAVLEGLRSAGADGELAFLPEMSVERCRQCDQAGWGNCRTEGKCVIEDDFAGLVRQLKRAGAAVFATPVYFGDLSESIRAFLDRLRRTCMHESGKEGLAGKPVVGVCVAGGGGGGAPSCAASLEKVLAVCGFDVIDMIPVRRQNLQMKLHLLRAVGKWLAGRPSS
ncbi:MAG: flavodoxin family protein [Planctomycetota bacterium]|jgi:multimeric flavodoxin WrbA